MWQEFFPDAGVTGILISLALLILLAWKNFSVIMMAPLCALVAVVIDGSLPVLAAYTQIFMASAGQFIVSFFPMFLLGAIFGKLMEDTGSASSIADCISRAVGPRRVILATVLSCAVLTYGGVSLFVVVFAVFPLCREMFRTAGIPRRLIPAAIALGSFTFTMTALPGSVQIQNLIPMETFGTNSWAAPGLGIIGGWMMFVPGMLWLNRRVREAEQSGEGFGDPPVAAVSSQTNDSHADSSLATTRPAIGRALAPIVCMIVLNYLLSRHVIPGWNADYLNEPRFGATTLTKVTGSWAAILSMTATIALTILLNYRSLDRLRTVMTQGANLSLLPVFNTASEVGYGSTIAALSSFASVRGAVMGYFPGHPLVSEAVAVNALAAITGSASGGLGIALKALGGTFVEQAKSAGISPELMHRVASMSCGGLDSLPHNGALITLLIICGVTHRQSYKDVAVVTILCPLLGTVTVIVLGTLFGSF